MTSSGVPTLGWAIILRSLPGPVRKVMARLLETYLVYAMPAKAVSMSTVKIKMAILMDLIIFHPPPVDKLINNIPSSEYSVFFDKTPYLSIISFI